MWQNHSELHKMDNGLKKNKNDVLFINLIGSKIEFLFIKW